MLIRSDKPDAPTNAEASAELRITVKDTDQSKVGRRFADAATELALAGYPGFHLTSPPTDATAYGVFWPALVPAELVEPVVIQADGTRVVVPHRAFRSEVPAGPLPELRQAAQFPAEPVARLPLGTIIGARSGDKGGNANVGLWAGRTRTTSGCATSSPSSAWANCSPRPAGSRSAGTSSRGCSP